MSTLHNKQIILGVSGGIAAYKAADLTRRLKEQGAQVRVVMTKAATEFVQPLTFQALSGQPVHLGLLDTEAEAAMGHIELAKWADLVLVAPASADCMARISQGMADDLLTTLCLATDAPIALAPAMNQAMWRNPFTQRNAELLRQHGVQLFGPGSGEQACGDVGPGRMLEPMEIVAHCEQLFAAQNTESATQPLQGVRLIITAGPTREPLDPVRYISNHSSGKMGFALAQAAVEAGADTTLIAGPVNLATPAGVKRIDVESAQQMYDAAMAASDHSDIFIASAAVADYRPVTAAEQKIKKTADAMTVELTKNPDIVASIAAKTDKPFTVGFAAETHDVVSYAQDKMQRKNLDMIIANDVANQAIGFNSDDNAVTVLWPGGQQSIGQTDKQSLARQLIQLITQRYQQQAKP